MDSPTRVPPRFVPTLTTVVDLEAEAEPAPAPERAQVSDAAAQPDVPPEALAPYAPSAFAATTDAWAPGISAPAELAPYAEALDGAASTSLVLDPGGPDPAPEAGTEHIDGAAMAFASVPPADSPVRASAHVNPQPPAALPVATSDGFRAISPIHEADAFRLEEELLHRVLQRVDLSLEERLTEVVSATVQQQLDAMVPRLRDQVEAALRQLVVEAMAHELSETPGSGPPSGAPSLG